MTGKEEINRDVDKFKASKRKEMAKKMKGKKENNLFESADKTIKRIKGDWDSRY